LLRFSASTKVALEDAPMSRDRSTRSIKREEPREIRKNTEANLKKKTKKEGQSKEERLEYQPDVDRHSVNSNEGSDGQLL
jgi:hypothetical protein